jgi:serine/threonine protein kinase
MIVNDLTDAKRLQMTKAILKALSYINSLGVFHNNLNLYNVMLSKRSEVKVHELDSISRQGSVF